MKVLIQCRICGCSNFSKIISYKRINSDGVYSSRKTQAKKFKKRDITLLQCQSCGFIQLKEIIDSEIYTDYNFASANTGEILEWIKILSKKLRKKYKISDKKILEIGSGDGSFSQLFNDENKVLAIEPSKKLAKYSNKNGVLTIQGYFDKNLVKKIDEKFDWIIVRHVLEHIDKLKSFCENLNSSLKEDGYIYLEQPYVKEIFKTQNFFNIFYEHINYFRIKDINKLFKIYGLKIIDFGFNKINNGSSWVVLSKSKRIIELPKNEITKRQINRFIDEFNKLNKTFKKLKKIIKGKKVCGYGAANKTYSILNLGGFTQNDLIEIYDKNINLQDKYIPYFNYKVVDPKLVLQTRPQFIIIFATAYQEEITNYLRQLNYKGKIIEVFPHLKIQNL